MRRCLFNRILTDICLADEYFIQKFDAVGIPGLSSIQKITAIIRCLCYGLATDAVDEYLRIAESTVSKCLKRFCEAVIDVYEKEYLRQPTEQDMKRWLDINAKRGFPGMFGSLDCT